MCRSQADGGRRCIGHKLPTAAEAEAMAHKPVPCGMCGGSGVSRLVPTKACQRCSGSGIDPYASR